MSKSRISDQVAFWSLEEIKLLFGPIADHELRRILTESGIEPAGVRPPAGRGRPPSVYPAGAVCDILGTRL